MKKKTPTRTTAVDRAIDIVELLSKRKMALSLQQIMNKLDIPKQSLIRIMNTLCDRGILNKAEQRGYYRLGINFLYIGNNIQEKIKLREVAWPFMQELYNITHKTVGLLTCDRNQIILLEQIQGKETANLYAKVGSVYPYFHAIAAGKIYLAHFDPEKRKKLLKKIGLPSITDNTITDFHKLEKDLIKIRENKFAFEDQELHKGIRRIVAPIYNHLDELAGCISISATVLNLKTEDVDSFGYIAVETAQKISKALNHNTLSN